MTQSARDIILSTLKQAPKGAPLPARPQRPAVDTACPDREALVDRLRLRLEELAVDFFRGAGDAGVLAALSQILPREGICRAVASTDPVIAGLNLPAWAQKIGVTITTRRDYADRTAFKKALFTESDAGITGVDFGVAESGTLGLLAGPDMPRLISLAPVTHIAVLPVERLVAHYEEMARRVFAGRPPSQLFWITGPSQTGDIQATLFRGMHGPRKLIVILKESA